MGQVASAVRQCTGLKPRTKKSKDHNEFVTVLVVGDSNVGKTTLIDNYLEEHTDPGSKEESAPLSPAPKNTDALRQKSANQLFRIKGESFSIRISLVEVNGSMDVSQKCIRDSYYKTADIVFIIYSVDKVDSLYHAEHVWYKEIVNSVGKDVKRGKEMQIVMVGVNPEARDKLEESDVYSPDREDENEELFRRNTMKKSIRRGEGERVSQRLKHANSQRETRHFEVKKERTNVIDFFHTVVQDYVMQRAEEQR